MVRIELIGFMIDWTLWMLEISFLSLTYPTGYGFRTDSLFAFNYDREGEIFLELLFITIIGKKYYE